MRAARLGEKIIIIGRRLEEKGGTVGGVIRKYKKEEGRGHREAAK